MTAVRQLAIKAPFNLAATMLSVASPGGSTSHTRGGTYRRATNTRAGPAQLSLHMDGSAVVAQAWGPGADLELDGVARLLGLDDVHDATAFPAGAMRELARRNRGLRLGATGKVFEELVPTILGQRITSGEAKRSYYSLVRAFGEPAPGPAGLRLPPLPTSLASLDYSEFHRHGVERSRAVIIREAARRSKRLEEIVDMEREAAYSRLKAIRGIGPWTAGHVMGVAWGDRDAVPIGDFHLPNSVAWLLAKEPRADDARMLELLEPYRPHRRRAVLLLKLGRVAAPKYGPRVAVQDIRAH